MRLGVAITDDRGFDAPISEHFGRCPYYLLVEIANDGTRSSEVVPNPFYHAHGAPGEVPAFLRKHKIDAMICGGMGPRAVQFFQQYGIETITSARGTAREAVESYCEQAARGEWSSA